MPVIFTLVLGSAWLRMKRIVQDRHKDSILQNSLVSFWNQDCYAHLLAIILILQILILQIHQNFVIAEFPKSFHPSSVIFLISLNIIVLVCQSLLQNATVWLQQLLSESCVSRVRCYQVWLLPRAMRNNLFCAFPLASDGLAGNLGIPLACRSISHISAFIFTWHPCAPVSKFPFYKDTNHTELGVHPTEVWPHLTNYVCSDPVSKWGHVFWGARG